SALKQLYNMLTLSGPKYAKIREKTSQQRETVFLSATARTSKVLGGVSSLLSYVIEPFESLTHEPLSFTGPNGYFEYTKKYPGTSFRDYELSRLPLTSSLKHSENYYDKQAEQLNQILDDKHNYGVHRFIADVGTQAVFFEALGGAKASNLFKLA